jgi:dihydroflavonol-4-reductase
VLDENTLQGAADGCDFVFHAAAIFSYSGYSLEYLEDLAVRGTRNVLSAASEANVSRVIVTSSTIVLGSSSTTDVRDEQSPFDDKHPSNYTLSKVCQERAAIEIASELGLDLIVVCPGLTIGSHDYRLGPSNASIANYLNDPLRSTFLGGCNIVSAQDVAKGHIIAALRGESGARYVLGGENLYWKDVHTVVSKLAGTFGPSLTLNHTATYLAAAMAETSARLMGKPPVVTRDEAVMAGRFYWYSNAAIKRLGFQPGSTEEALAETLAWLIHRAFLNESVLDNLSPDPRVLDHYRAISGAMA